MDDSLARRPAARPRRLSTAAADSGANVSLQDGEVSEGIELQPAREPQTGADRPGAAAAAAGITDRRNSAPQGVHQRHMPMEPKKFQIPKKTREKRALFRDVSTESREFEDMVNILTSSYFDAGSAGCFTYCKPRLVYSELPEKEFVERRREMKMDGRTDTELEESYGFMLVEAPKVHQLCESGLCVGQSWITVLGNPSKGVYLSRYSDLLQINPFTPGATGEIIIFKVMKGKVKSIYENMKNILDPTPRFDSHIFKNSSKVTSLTSYRAFEFTQHYFYEYQFDELRQRPRQVCPYAVVSLLFKGKDTPLLRMNSQISEVSKERAQFTVWTGDLVQGDRVLFQISLRSFSPPFLPHRLPEKLKIGCVMRLVQVTKVLPSSLFSYHLYSSSQEVVEDGHCCSLLEVVDKSRSTTNVTKLLQELEMTRVVLVTPLTERGFLFLLSSVQMTSPSEREGDWKRCLQALFVFPESRDVSKSTSRWASSTHDASVSMSAATLMPRLSTFIPALHHALVKTRANPAPELSAGVERQAKEYLIGLEEGKVRPYPMGEYDSNQEEQEKDFPAPKHHKVNMDYYLRSYLHNPALYLLSVARARQVVEAHCGPEEPQQERPRKSCAGQRESTGKEVTSSSTDGQSNTKKLQQLVDLVLTCKRNAENEVKREERGEGSLKRPGRKRRKQQVAARALKFLKATQEPGRDSKIPVDGGQTPGSPDSLTSVIGSVGLRDVDLREDGSELAAQLFMLLTGLKQSARGLVSQDEEPRESSPFDRLAAKLGLPTNCDIDLRKQEELEEQTAGSVSSLEGFSPSSHSGEMNRRGLGRGAGVNEGDEDEGLIPWVLIPITGLSSDRYSQRDRNIPTDPRFQHLATATSSSTTTKPPGKTPAPSPPSPEPSPPPFPSQCPSPDPSPPLSPSQCPSPEPSPPLSPSQCPSPELSPPTSPSRCPSLQTPQSTFHRTSPTPSPSLSWFQSPEPMEHIPPNKGFTGANEERLAPTASREFKGMSRDRREKNEEPSVPPAPERRTSPSSPLSVKEHADGEMQEMEERGAVTPVEEKESQPVEKVQKQREEKAPECKRGGEEVGDMEHEVASEHKQKGEVKEKVGGSSPSVSSAPTRPLRDIDSIVDKHLGNFSSEMQLLLQEESIHYSFPQSPHSTSNTETTAPLDKPPQTLTSQFSEYVSLYNPCLPVNDYVSSLKDGINSMLVEFGGSRRSHDADTSRTNSDKLASSVSAFVASIRAGNPKSGSEDESSAPGDEPGAAHPGSSVSQTPALSRGGEVWQPDATRQFPDATTSRSSPTSNVTLSTPTSASGSVYKSNDTTDCHAPSDKLSQSHWKPQQSPTSEIHRTGAQDIRLTQDRNFRIIHRATDVEAGRSDTGLNLTPPAASSVSRPSLEPPPPAEPVSSSASVSAFAPPTTVLSNLINQLQPEVFSSLVKIIKDVKKKTLQFYLHSTEERDPLLEDIREHMLKHGNMEQSPVTFLNHENPDNRLLVIIQNKDIAGHIHKIPNLVSLKRRPSVVFVGIDTLGDIRNNSYNELFVSGGCIISDEMILNPDFISHGRLAELLLLLEQHGSLESVWKWKVHCKTHKKLKEQARFSREAANVLDLLSAYQKRQIVEFLPYHHCDMMNHQSPDLDCLIELQARYTQYRHTIFLTEHCHEKLPAYSSRGVIVAGIEELLHSFTRLIGCHDIKDKQPAKDVLLANKECSVDLCSLLTTVSQKIMATNHSSNPCVELHNLMPLGIRELTGTRERDQPPPASSQDSSCSCLTPPLLTSPLANSTKGQRGEEHGYSPVDPSPEQGLHRPVRQEHVGLNGQTDNYSKLIRLLDESESLSARPVTPQHSVRLQLYNRQYQKFRDRQLLDPKVWKDIYYSRPGRVPNHQPYHHLGERYRELRATSTVAFASSARHRSHQWRVACGVTCYNHPEGPWCEVQSQDGTQICILAALPMGSPVSCCFSDCSPPSSGPGWQLSPGDSVSGSERSASIIPEHIPPLSSSEPPKHLTQQPSSGLNALHHLTDQLVPDASFKDGGPLPSDTDFEVLSQAISQLRAERQAQLLQQRLECQERVLSSSLHRGSGQATPPVGQGGLIESVQFTAGRNTVADTHSTLQPERRQDRGEPPTEGQRRGSALGGGGLLGVKSVPRIGDASTSSSNNNAAAVTGPNGQTDPTSAEREPADQRAEPAFSKAAQHGAAASSTFSCPVEGDRSRDALSGQEQPISAEEALPRISTASDTEVSGSVSMATGQEDNSHPALLQQIQEQQHYLQLSTLNPQPLAHSRRQQWSILPPRFPPPIPSQHFSTGPTLRPRSAQGGTIGLLGPPPTWPGGVVWSFPQALPPPQAPPSLLGVYYNPAAQGSSSRYRGGQRGGFNGM